MKYRYCQERNKKLDEYLLTSQYHNNDEARVVKTMSINWASSSLGAKLVDFSSEVQGCEAANVLEFNLPQLWLSEEGVPQWLCISLASVKADRRNECIRTIGWHCWHPYTTNPQEVTVHVSDNGTKFKVWDTFVCSQSTKGTHLFCCAPISIRIYPFIALEVTQTFGGRQTYMNRVYFYSDEIPASPLPTIGVPSKTQQNIQIDGSVDNSEFDTSNCGKVHSMKSFSQSDANRNSIRGGDPEYQFDGYENGDDNVMDNTRVNSSDSNYGEFDPEVKDQYDDSLLPLPIESPPPHLAQLIDRSQSFSHDGDYAVTDILANNRSHEQGMQISNNGKERMRYKGSFEKVLEGLESIRPFDDEDSSSSDESELDGENTPDKDIDVEGQSKIAESNTQTIAIIEIPSNDTHLSNPTPAHPHVNCVDVKMSDEMDALITSMREQYLGTSTPLKSLLDLVHGSNIVEIQINNDDGNIKVCGSERLTLRHNKNPESQTESKMISEVKNLSRQADLSHIAKLMQALHAKVRQRTIEEAKLKLIRRRIAAYNS